MNVESGQRFEAKKPLIGRVRGGVVVDDAVVRFEHPLLKEPVVVPIDQIAAVVEPAGSEADPLLLRDVRVIGLVSGGLASANVVVVFRSPVRVDRFRLGAEQVLAISARERRRGVDVDAIGVEVQDPHGLREVLGARGAAPATSLAAALVSVVGEASGPIADERRREVQRARRRQRLLGVLVGVAAAALLSAQATFALSGEPEAALIARMAAAAVAGAIAAGAVGSVVLGALARRNAVHSASRAALIGVTAIAALAVLVLVRLQADRWVGAPYVLAHAALGATSGGWVLAISFRDGADPAPQSGPLVADHGGRLLSRALAAAVALTSVAIIASREPGVTRDLAIARAAIVAAHDLPSGWVSCCVARAYRGSALDEHICGSAGIPPHTAGFDRQFALNLADDRSSGGNIVEAVFLAPSVDAARREFAATDAPGYAACARASVERRARAIVSAATGEPQTSSTRSRLPDGGPGIVDRFTTTLAVPGGRDVVFTAFVRMHRGRAIVRMPIITYAAPLTDEELVRIVGPAARTLERALR